MAQNLSKKTRWLHWLVATFMIILFITGQIGENIPRENRGFFYMMHGSFGMIVLVLGSYRLFFRLRDGWPEPLNPGNKILEIIAKAVHWVLAVLPVIIPIFGLLIFLNNGRGIAFFGLTLIPGSGEANKSAAEFFGELHELGAQIFIIALALHIAGAIKHHFIDKDDTLKRMVGKAD